MWTEMESQPAELAAEGTSGGAGDRLVGDGEEDATDQLTPFGVSGIDAATVAVSERLDAAECIGKRMAAGNGIGGAGDATESKEEGGQPVHLDPATRALEEHVRR